MSGRGGPARESGEAPAGFVRKLRERLYPYRPTVGEVLLDLGGLLGAAALTAALVAGTIAHVALPSFEEARRQGCYFTDTLIVLIECSGHPVLGGALSLAWWWTWGLIWPIGFLPFSAPVVALELIAIALTVRLARRLWRG